MSIIVDDLSKELAHRLKAEREARNWTIADLSERAGVSRAMISKIERNEASPTAALLGRLAGAFGLTLSTLLARAEQRGGRVAQLRDQSLWRDPETGYLRRAVSPQDRGPLELVWIRLPAHARVEFPASGYTFRSQQIWIIRGQLNLSEGDTLHELKDGDCLALGPPENCTFHCPGPKACEYLVVIARR